MYTDPTRLRATDPGNVEGNPVFVYHDAFNKNVAEVADLKARYAAGTVGDVEVKEKLFVALEEFLTPIRNSRAELTDEYINQILTEGNAATRAIVVQTLNEMKSQMGLKTA
jgi:tryptophanyl-tRNA synthetase